MAGEPEDRPAERRSRWDDGAGFVPETEEDPRPVVLEPGPDGAWRFDDEETEDPPPPPPAA